MDILQQCHIWQEQGRHELIVNLIESLPDEQRTALVECELAKACIDMAQIDSMHAKDILWLKKAVALLKKHEAELSDTFKWNFRLGYAYFYLEQHDLSIKYMQKALLLHSSDHNDGFTKEDVEYFRSSSEQKNEMPISIHSFLDRVYLAWGEFKQRRSQIEDLINNNEHDKAIALLDDCFHVLFDEINFELSIKGKVYEVIFPTECDLATILQLKTFIAHTPSKVKKHWSFIIGRPADANLIIDNGAATLTSQDFTVYSCDLGNSRYDLKIIAPKIKKFVSSDEQAQKLAFYFISNTLGEINYLNHVAGLEVLNEDANINDLSGYDQSCSIDSFIEKLKEQGLELNNDVKSLTDSCLKHYQQVRLFHDEICSRLDIDHGSSFLLGLHYEYLAGDGNLYNSFYHNGAVPVFICFEQTNHHQSSSLHISDSQLAQMVATIRNKTSALATIVGYAAGLHYGYIDCIAWDLQKFITTVDNILGRDNKIKRAACQVFSQSNKYLQLKPVAHTVNVRSICGFSSLDELNGLLEQRNFTQIYNQLTKEPVAKNNFEIDCRILNTCVYIAEFFSNYYYEVEQLIKPIINYGKTILNHYKKSEYHHPDWLYYYGILTYNNGELEEAVNAFAKLVAQAPDYPQAKSILEAYTMDYNTELDIKQAKGFSSAELEKYHDFSAIVLLKKPIENEQKLNALFKKHMPDYYNLFNSLPTDDNTSRFFNHDFCYLTVDYNAFNFPIPDYYFNGNKDKQNILRNYKTAISIDCSVANNRHVAETSIFFNHFLKSLFELNEVVGIVVNNALKTKDDFIIPDNLSSEEQYLRAAKNIINISGFIAVDDGSKYISSYGLLAFGFHEMEICVEDYPIIAVDTLYDCLHTLVHLLLSKQIKLIPGKVTPFVKGLTVRATPSKNNVGEDCWRISIPMFKQVCKKRLYRRR